MRWPMLNGVRVVSLMRSLIDKAGRPGLWGRVGERADRPQREIRMTVGPIQDPLDQVAPHRLRYREMLRQDRCLVQREVGQLDAVADVERRAGRVLDEISDRQGWPSRSLGASRRASGSPAA